MMKDIFHFSQRSRSAVSLSRYTEKRTAYINIFQMGTFKRRISKYFSSLFRAHAQQKEGRTIRIKICNIEGSLVWKSREVFEIF